MKNFILIGIFQIATIGAFPAIQSKSRKENETKIGMYFFLSLILYSTQMDRENRTEALLWSKMAFFTRAWWKVKVLPRP